VAPFILGAIARLYFLTAGGVSSSVRVASAFSFESCAMMTGGDQILEVTER
jgi:hypothetical protein